MRIYIDPGHGGRDPGAVGNGLQEKDITLELALALAFELKNYECEVRLAREEDIYVDNGDRAREANAWKADLFYSIHCNGHTNTDANGYEDFIHPAAPEKTQDIRKAVHIRNAEVWTDLGRENRGRKTADFQVLRETRMSAVLVEHGFLTNRVDAKLLQNSVFKAKLVSAMLNGIVVALDLQQMKEGPFIDVPPGHPWVHDVAWVKKKGIMLGVGAGYFKPNSCLTRGGAAVVAKRLYDTIMRDLKGS